MKNGEPMPQNLFDVVIIGTGPAGIQAAIHASRKQTSVLVLGRIENSSLYSGHIENYAFVGGVTTGHDMLQQGVSQAKGFGAQFLEEDPLQLKQEDDFFNLRLESGKEIQARALILSMGVAKKKLGAEGEKDFLGKGVSYCVDCDANFFRNAVVCVTGDRSAAADGALTLQAIAAKVYLVAKDLDISEELSAQLKSSGVERIESTVTKVNGEKLRGVQSIELENGQKLEVEGLFIEMGSKGALQLATLIGVQLDSESMKYITVNRLQETNIAGVYAAGDITGPPYQMAKAVGEGCIAGMEAATYARAMRKKEAAK